MKRVFSILMAAAVVAALYLLVFEREAVIAFAAGDDSAATSTEEELAPEGATLDVSTAIKVVAMRSAASRIDRAVLVRGQGNFSARSTRANAKSRGGRPRRGSRKPGRAFRTRPPASRKHAHVSLKPR